MAKWKESTFQRRAQQKEHYERYRRELAESLELALSHQRQSSPDPYSDDRDYALMGGTADYDQSNFCCGVAADRDGVLDEVKAWSERILQTCVFAHDHPLSSGVNASTIVGIEWARQRLLDHIEAMRL